MARWHVTVTVGRDGFEDVVLRFDRSPITIGASATSDVVLAGPQVSRAHATITVSAGQMLYRDRSSNGSFVNGRRVEEVSPAPGDVVTIPPYRLSFRLETQEIEKTEPAPGLDELPIPPGPSPVAHAPRPRSAFRMRLTNAPGELQGRTFSFETDAGPGHPLVIGRASDAQISLDLPSVSRRHAVLALLPDGRWQISDGGSRNGIAINGTRQERAVLNDGDEISFGADLTAVFEQQHAAPEEAPADESLSLSHRPSSFDSAVTVVGIGGRVDGYNYAEFREHLHQLLDAGAHLLILDFSRCGFCDHVGLSVVLSAKTALDKQRGALCLIGVDRKLRDGLSLLRLDTLLAIEADEAAAVRRLVR
jgi:anti-anti-sigma factor